jgi:hypothetical protein
VGAQASAWFGDGAINSVAGIGEVSGTSGWNAENIWVPTTPGMSCTAGIAVETSANIAPSSVLLAVNREPSQQNLGAKWVGPLSGWTWETFQFTPEDTGELFFAGFWGQSDAPWMLFTDLLVSCAPHLDLPVPSRPNATDTYVWVTGGGFANGPVRIWYQGVPFLGDGDGWQYGAVLQASSNAIDGVDSQTLTWGNWSGCEWGTPSNNVQVMAIDSAGNRSNVQTAQACRICGTC